jgi:hypothetical protein
LAQDVPNRIGVFMKNFKMSIAQQRIVIKALYSEYLRRHDSVFCKKEGLTEEEEKLSTKWHTEQCLKTGKLVNSLALQGIDFSGKKWKKGKRLPFSKEGILITK